jgi:membrane-associated protease RseP (regulator of RpoE activity)
VILFLVTVVTTIMAGALQAKGTEAFVSFENLLSGIPFSAALLGILLAHEMGHYFASRYYGVPASLPYFIPVPTIIGTMGAVIRMRAPIRDRRILFDIGIAGPLAGIAVAIPSTIVGLHYSQIIQVGSTQGGIELGDSLLFMGLTRWVFGSLGETQTVLLHPVAFAGWLGFFVTSLNLLPMGQLDGGHVMYGILGPRHRFVSRGAFIALVVWGVHGVFNEINPTAWLWAFGFGCVAVLVASSGSGSPLLRGFALFLGIMGIVENYVPSTTVWVVWAILMCFLRLDHPPTRDIAVQLDPGRKALGWIALALFLLTFIPEPFRELLP